ncbi:MAG: hypothetical protein NDJ90_04665, partial [Oligoflexia bacterium]|nr:hypothetical protein [Oligoflexia bacterium]
LTALALLGEGVVGAIDVKAWREWLPRGIARAIERVAAAAAFVDSLLSARLRTGLAKAVELPARGLQLLQNGDVQWYLFFAIGSGVVMLVYYLRN